MPLGDLTKKNISQVCKDWEGWRAQQLLRCGAVHAQGRFLRPSSGERRVVHSAHYTAAGRSVSAIPSPFPSASTLTQNTATHSAHSPPLRPRPRPTPAGCQFELFAVLTRVHGCLRARFGPAISLPLQNTTNMEAQRADEATVERRLWYNAAPPRHNARPALH